MGQKTLNCSRFRALVSPIAIITFVDKWVMTISFELTFFQIHWCCILIHLICQWNLRFVVRRMALLLSALKLNKWLGNLYSRVAQNRPIYKPFFLVFVIALYSASVEDETRIAFSFDWWDTGLLDLKKPYLCFDHYLSSNHT